MENNSFRQGFANMTGKRAILIAGPTASGKSALAMELAAARNGVIVNADSMQVYEELRIISARPSAEDEAKVPHRLYGMISARKRYSVGSWVEDIKREVQNIESAGQIPVIVGGTGLYFKTLLEGLAQIPVLPEEVVEKWRCLNKEKGAEVLYKILQERDSDLADKLEGGDSQRIVRALAVLEGTGRSLLDWQREAQNEATLLLEDCDTIYLDTDRDWLYERINRRFDEMITNGGLEEIRALKDFDLDPTLPAMKALGIPRLIAHLNGDLSLEEAIVGAKTDTRRYAKRQRTWFRTQMPGWNWKSVSV